MKMKNIKHFEEYYYDNNGNDYDDIEKALKKSKAIYYIPDNLEKFIPKINKIKSDLIAINDSIEEHGPIDEEIQDAIDALVKVLWKWDHKPVTYFSRKFNL